MEEGDCKAYRQEEDNMACCQDIDDVEEEEDKVGIGIEVVAAALLGHQEFDWTHHYLLIRHCLGIGSVIDSAEMEEEEEDTENSMEGSSSLDQTVACRFEEKEAACSSHLAFLALGVMEMAAEAMLLPTLDVVEASRILQKKASESMDMVHPMAKEGEEASRTNEDQALALRKD